MLPAISLLWLPPCVNQSHWLSYLRSRSVSVPLHWPSHYLPSSRFQQPYWLAPKYWNIFNAHTLSYIKSVLQLQDFVLYSLTFWRRNYLLNFSTPCIENVNNTGTKYAKIMKQTAFWRAKTESIYHVYFLILAHPVHNMWIIRKQIRYNYGTNCILKMKKRSYIQCLFFNFSTTCI